jgi:hypothetical protein
MGRRFGAGVVALRSRRHAGNLGGAEEGGGGAAQEEGGGRGESEGRLGGWRGGGWEEDP